MDYKDKYLKYKLKYLQLKFNQLGGKKLTKRKSKSKSKNNKRFKNKFNSNNTNNMDRKVMNVSEPWYTLISLGIKTIEGRLNKGKFKEMQVGDIIEWTNNDFNKRSTITRITKKISYNTFEEYLQTEGLENCLPGINNIEDGKNVYYKYYSQEAEREFGVLAIGLEII